MNEADSMFQGPFIYCRCVSGVVLKDNWASGGYWTASVVRGWRGRRWIAGLSA